MSTKVSFSNATKQPKGKSLKIQDLYERNPERNGGNQWLDVSSKKTSDNMKWFPNMSYDSKMKFYRRATDISQSIDVSDVGEDIFNEPDIQTLENSHNYGAKHNSFKI